MILEYAQLLSTAHRTLDSVPNDSPLYKATHVNHPCAVWVRKGDLHYAWLYLLFMAICDEYTFRYGKIHKTDANLRNPLRLLPENIPHISVFEEPPQAVTPECKIPGNAIQAYRNYYMKEKRHIASWKKRGPPEWWT